MFASLVNHRARPSVTNSEPGENSAPRPSREVHPSVEQLDQRIVPASPSTKVQILPQGVVRVVANDRDNNLNVSFGAVRIDKQRGGFQTMLVVRDEASRVPRRINVRGMQELQVLGAGGADTIQVNYTGLKLPPAGLRVVVDGGVGDDVLKSNISHALLIGGPGLDTIRGVKEVAPPVQPPIIPPVIPPVTPPEAPSVDLTLSRMVEQIVELVNQARTDAGLQALTVSVKLTSMAKIQTGQMVTYDRMAHDIPEAPLPSMVSRAQAVNYQYYWLGENIAYGYRGAADVMAGWMASKGHRDNILNPNFKEFGVDVAQGKGGLYFCQNFGDPAVGLFSARAALSFWRPSKV